MALILWLPFSDNLNNQGLSNLNTFASSTFVKVNGDGKIGPNSYKGGGVYHLNDYRLLNNKWTIATWLKSSSWTPYNDIIACKNVSASDHCEFYLSVFNGSNLNLAINTNASGATTPYTFTVDVWHHVVASYDGVNYKLYINGVNVKSGTCTNTLFTDCLNLGIGTRSTNAQGTSLYSSNICFNDFRIYDNVLSDKEVEVLSRGLVLHYPLDREGFGQDNIASQYVVCGGNAPGNQGSTARTQYLCDYGIKIPAVENADTYFSIWYSEPLEVGQTYTLSAHVSNLLGGTSYPFRLFSQSHTSFQPFIINHNGLVSLTFTMDYTDTIPTNAKDGVTYYKLMMDDVNRTISPGQQPIEVRDFKLEKGDKVTPWVPNVHDSLYDTMGLNSNIVYDVSGYKYNGTLSGPTYSSDTAKYSVSTSFDGADDAIALPQINIQKIFNNECTISFWVKPNGETNARSVYFGAYSQVTWNIEKNASNRFRAWWQGNPDDVCNTFTIVDDEWQHLAITKIGNSDVKFYYNGELKQTFTGTHSPLTFGTTWRIGKDQRSNDGTQYKGLMSDFRIYATALSPEAIAELYHTGASLANNGTLMTNQFVEV